MRTELVMPIVVRLNLVKYRYQVSGTNLPFFCVGDDICQIYLVCIKSSYFFIVLKHDDAYGDRALSEAEECFNVTKIMFLMSERENLKYLRQ